MGADQGVGVAGAVGADLQARAERVIPGAAGYRRAFRAELAAVYPLHLVSGEGATVTDADGATYVDLMGSYGPNLLGHRHPAVEEAAARQRALGDALGARAPVTVELAEHLCDRFAEVEWAFFGKNGSDATAFALRVARVATGRTRVLIAEQAYHTAHDWASMSDVGVPEAHRSLTSHVAYDDPDGLRAAVDAADGDLAAIMITPFQKGYFDMPRLPSPAFVDALHREARRAGAVLVVDDVRAGMRMHPSGASAAAVGLDADLTCYAKSIANGRALSVCTGTAALRDAADRAGYLGTFFANAVPQAACLATFRAFDAEGAFDRLTAVGTRLSAGLVEVADAAGVSISMEGVPAMAMPDIAGDGPFRALAYLWAAAMVRRGVLVHPTQPWYLCAALTDAQVDAVLERAAGAFDEVADALARRAAG